MCGDGTKFFIPEPDRFLSLQPTETTAQTSSQPTSIESKTEIDRNEYPTAWKNVSKSVRRARNLRSLGLAYAYAARPFDSLFVSCGLRRFNWLSSSNISYERIDCGISLSVPLLAISIRLNILCLCFFSSLLIVSEMYEFNHVERMLSADAPKTGRETRLRAFFPRPHRVPC